MTPVKLLNALVGSQIPKDSELFYGFALVNGEARVYLRNSTNRRWTRRPALDCESGTWDTVRQAFKAGVGNRWGVSAFRVADDKTLAVARLFSRNS